MWYIYYSPQEFGYPLKQQSYIAVKRLQYEFRAKAVKKKKVNLTVSIEGLHIQLQKKPKKVSVAYLGSLKGDPSLVTMLPCSVTTGYSHKKLYPKAPRLNGPLNMPLHGIYVQLHLQHQTCYFVQTTHNLYRFFRGKRPYPGFVRVCLRFL